MKAAVAYLRRYREGRNLRQEDVARAMAVSKRTITNWETVNTGIKMEDAANYLDVVKGSGTTFMRLFASTDVSEDEARRIAERELSGEKAADHEPRRRQSDHGLSTTSEAMIAEYVSGFSQEERDRIPEILDLIARVARETSS